MDAINSHQQDDCNCNNMFEDDRPSLDVQLLTGLVGQYNDIGSRRRVRSSPRVAQPGYESDAFA